MENSSKKFFKKFFTQKPAYSEVVILKLSAFIQEPPTFKGWSIKSNIPRSLQETGLKPKESLFNNSKGPISFQLPNWEGPPGPP